MRLTTTEITDIKNTILRIDENADIYLYGSRVDDAKRGGDIDLLVISDIIDFNKKIEIVGDLFEALGEQKIDILVEHDFSKPFIKHIKNTVVKL